MEFIHFVSKATFDSIKDKELRAENHSQGYGIFIYPLIKIDFKAPTLEFVAEEKEINCKLTIEESWEAIGASHIRQANEKVIGLVFNLSPEFWPIEINIDVGSDISKQFATKFVQLKSDDVFYKNNLNLMEVVESISAKKYSLETKFKVLSESGLRSLIECYKNSGGGIWGAISVYCLVTKNIEANMISRIVKF